MYKDFLEATAQFPLFPTEDDVNKLNYALNLALLYSSKDTGNCNESGNGRETGRSRKVGSAGAWEKGGRGNAFTVSTEIFPRQSP